MPLAGRGCAGIESCRTRQGRAFWATILLLLPKCVTMMAMRRLLLSPAVFLFFAFATFAQTASDASRQSFHITPLKPVEELRREALEAQPPIEQGKHKSDLVEVTKVDPRVKLDIRYASDNNFMATPFYSEARAFLQRPAAHSLAAADRELHRRGYGILIHDA